MDNESKRYVSNLERRILRLEYIIEAINNGIQCAPTGYSCQQCGVFDPLEGFVCGVKDCCQGFNPNDDVVAE